MPLVEHQVRSGCSFTKMQMVGLTPDWDEVEKHRKNLNEQLKPVMQRMRKLPEVRKFERQTGRRFNPNSTGKNGDLIVLFRDILKRKEIESTAKKSGYSVDEKVLNTIPESASELPGLLLQMRGTEKLLSTYVDSLEGYTWPDGLIHPSVNYNKVVTGRSSMEEPNGQNWPSRKNKEIRSCIGAPEGHLLVAMDYGQIEARIIALLAEDEFYIKALWDRFDIHMDWAERFHHKYGDEKLEWAADKLELDKTDDKAMWKGLRFLCKNGWVFPRFYGASDNAASGYMEIDPDDSRRFGQEFWDMFEGVKKWQERLKREVRKHGYVEGPMGRRARLPMTLNQLFNYPVQGGASDVIVDAGNRAVDEGYQYSLNVHDDLTFVFARRNCGR